jgi:prepilin-type N-terminal cleavage/methylation domain-containing protein
MKTTHTKSHSGFTLIELSVVAAIIMVLATMALPNFQTTVSNAQVSAAQSQLGRMRTACDFYTFQHFEQIPGYDDATGLWSEQTLLNQLQLASNDDGITAVIGTAGYYFGPYLRDALPANPFNDLATIMVIQPGGTLLNADDTTGWVYWSDTGSFKINTTTVTEDGVVLFEL